MNSFFNMEIKRCIGNNHDYRCDMIMPMFSKGIYLCENHGDIRVSTFHTGLIKNDLYLLNKHLCIKYFKSNEYRHKKHVKEMKKLLYDLTSFNEDILYYIGKYI